MGNTTVVCGVKAEIAEPELDRGEEGFLGEQDYCTLDVLRLVLRHDFFLKKTKNGSSECRLTSNVFAEI